MNTFRHWFMWSAIEVAPGKYDWGDYDRMMDLAAQNHIRVIIAEIDIVRSRVGLSSIRPCPLPGERWHIPGKRHIRE